MRKEGNEEGHFERVRQRGFGAGTAKSFAAANSRTAIIFRAKQNPPHENWLWFRPNSQLKVFAGAREDAWTAVSYAHLSRSNPNDYEVIQCSPNP
jgi:hypothetical protein